MKCSLGISNFLEEVSNLSHSVVFLYFFALITEEGFLISPFYSLLLGAPELRVCTTITFSAPSLALCVPLHWMWAGAMLEGSPSLSQDPPQVQ